MHVPGLILLSILAAAFSAAEQPPPVTECPQYDRVEYSASQRGPAIVVEGLAALPSPATVAQDERHVSPHGTASYTVREPDTSKPGPWSTGIEIHGNKARPINLTLRTAEHISGGVRVRWLNEQLLWLQVWRGRIVSTDVIFDIETRRVIYEQEANYNGLIVPCSMRIGAPK